MNCGVNFTGLIGIVIGLARTGLFDYCATFHVGFQKSAENNTPPGHPVPTVRPALRRTFIINPVTKFHYSDLLTRTDLSRAFGLKFIRSSNSSDRAGSFKFPN